MILTILYILGSTILLTAIMNFENDSLLLPIFLLTLSIVIYITAIIITCYKFKAKKKFIKKTLDELHSSYTLTNIEKDYIVLLVSEYAEYRKDLAYNTNYFVSFTENKKCYFSNNYEFKTICLACIVFHKELKNLIAKLTINKDLDDSLDVDYTKGQYDFIAHIYKTLLINSLYPFNTIPQEVEEELEKQFYSLVIKHKK